VKNVAVPPSKEGSVGVQAAPITTFDRKVVGRGQKNAGKVVGEGAVSGGWSGPWEHQGGCHRPGGGGGLRWAVPTTLRWGKPECTEKKKNGRGKVQKVVGEKTPNEEERRKWLVKKKTRGVPRALGERGERTFGVARGQIR